MAKTVKKVKSTYDELMESLTPKEREEFEKEYRELALSELILAAMQQDDISVRKLAKIADVSPTIVQEMRSGVKTDFTMQSFFKILKGLGFNQFLVGRNGEFVNLAIPKISKKIR